MTDRLIQQILQQVLQPSTDPGFSDHCYGFRPGRRAHDAVLVAQRYVHEGYTVVMDVVVDLELELERRGHRFVRYADGCNVYVRSQKAGERLLRGMDKRYERLHLKVNETKTAVTNGFDRKFLAYCLWQIASGEIKRAVADEPLYTFKQRIRQMTCRRGGRNLGTVAETLWSYLPGRKAYFRLAQTPRVFREPDEWIRHRLRALQLKHWRRGMTMHRNLLTVGAPPEDARRVAGNSCRWWRNSRLALNRVMPIAYFDRLGVPRLS